jgi:hypothetical protein
MGSRQRLRSAECVSPSLASLAATVLGVPPSLRLFSSRTHAPCGGVAVRIAPDAVCMSVHTRAHLTAGCWFLLLSWLGCFPRYAQQLPKVDNIWKDFAARNLTVALGGGKLKLPLPRPPPPPASLSHVCPDPVLANHFLSSHEHSHNPPSFVRFPAASNDEWFFHKKEAVGLSSDNTLLASNELRVFTMMMESYARTCTHARTHARTQHARTHARTRTHTEPSRPLAL